MDSPRSGSTITRLLKGAKPRPSTVRRLVLPPVRPMGVLMAVALTVVLTVALV